MQRWRVQRPWKCDGRNCRHTFVSSLRSCHVTFLNLSTVHAVKLLSRLFHSSRMIQSYYLPVV